MELFAANLRKRAEELGISHAEAARRIGLSERRYGNYVSGRREPDLATLVRIAGVLGTTPNILLGVDEGGPRAEPKFDRLKAALSAVPARDFESVVVMVDALARYRSGTPDKEK